MAVTSSYVQTNGVRLHYLRAGRGPLALVLTHGNSLCAGVWAPLIEALAGDEFTVVATDLRGHGWSEQPDTGYDWSSLRDDLVALISALDLRDLLFVGHSRGGGVALLAAAALAGHTRGVLAFEPTVPPRLDERGRFAPFEDQGRLAAMAQRAERRRDVFPDWAALAAHYRGRAAFRDWRQDYFDAFLHYGTREQAGGGVGPCMPGRVAAQLFAVLSDVDAWRDAPVTNLPVHLVYGAASGRLVPDRDPLAVLRALYPACTMSVMDGATHTGPMERPERFEQLVRQVCRDWALPDAVQR